MTTATKKTMTCPNCGKPGVKSLKAHERYCIALHPELAPPAPEQEPEIETPAAEQIEPEVNPDNTEMKVAKILYNDIVKPLCEEYGITLRNWDEIDQSDYFKIAGKIIGEVKKDGR